MVLQDSLRVGRSAIAYLFQNVVPLERKDNLSFYDDVTAEGVDFPEMVQQPRELVLLRRAGEQLAEVRVGSMDVISVQGAQPTPAAFRLLVSEAASARPVKFFQDTAEIVYDKFRGVWGGKLGPLQLVEVSFQGTIAAGEEGSAGFFQNRVLRLDGGAQRHLGREFGQFGLKLGSGVIVDIGGVVTPEENLPSAQIDLQIDTNPQDPKTLTFQLLVKWPMLQLRLSGMQLPPEVRQQIGGREFLEMNREAKTPNVYVDAVYNYLNRQVMSFLRAAGR